MKEVRLTKGQTAVVDDEDYERVCSVNWWMNHNGYAVRSIQTIEGKWEGLFLHHFILGGKPAPGYDVDHINGIRLDKTKGNLRVCTKRQNSCNSKLKKSNTSGLKGASWSKTSKKWYAQIRIDGKKTSLGMHETAQDAHEAYCAAAVLHHKEFARFK